MKKQKVTILLIMLLSFTYCLRTTVAQLNLVVAQDGSGTHKTVSSALSAAPNYSKTLINIMIKKGIYRENIVVEKSKTNIVFIGEGIGQTIITGSRSVKNGWNIFTSATLGVEGDGFVARDLTIENTAGSGSQAVAFRSSADQTSLYRCAILGYQDTLFTDKGRQFYRECDIYGTVDFIFGNAAVVLQNCKIYPRQRNSNQLVTVLTAQGRDNPSTQTGISIQNCVIVAEAGTTGMTSTSYYGRPWRRYSRVVVMESYIGDVISPEGWLSWSGNARSLDNVYYAEYKNIGPRAYTSGRVKCYGCKIIGAGDAANFTVRRFIGGLEWIPRTGIPFSPDLNYN